MSASSGRLRGMFRSAGAYLVARSASFARPLEYQTDVQQIGVAVAEAARGIRYDAIEVVVHEGRAVQVARTEKRRISS
jgi:hypothetical protein